LDPTEQFERGLHAVLQGIAQPYGLPEPIVTDR
jgi:hypothetical protein